MSDEDVDGVLNRQIATEVNWEQFDKLKIIGLDEISLKKGHKNFVVIVSSRIKDGIKILAILPDRKKDTVKSFINSIPEHLRLTIKVACCDMYDGYIIK